MENILSEFEKSQDHTADIFRMQDDLSNCESELVALRIRFVHKNKECEELRLQLELKNRFMHEQRSVMECNAERFNSLEFHHDELIKKHKICLDCMKKQKNDYERVVTECDQLHVSYYWQKITDNPDNW